MRKLHQIKRLNVWLALSCVSIFTNIGQAANFLPLFAITTDTSQAENFVRRADTLQKDSAVIYYKKALDIYRAAKSTSDAADLWQRYFEIANLWCFSLKNREAALQQYPIFRKEILKKFGDNSYSLAENYYYHGRTITRLGFEHNEAAEVKFKKALAIYEANDLFAKVIELNKKTGIYFNYYADFKKATSYLRTALAQSIQHYGNEHKETAEIYHDIAQNYFEQGQYDKAAGAVDTTIAIKSKLYGPKSIQTASPIILMGNIHFKQATYDTAIDYYEQARAVYAQDSIKNLKNLANSIGNIGAALIEKGDFAAANAMYLKAIELKKIAVPEDDFSLAYPYYNVGAGLAEQGDFQLALDYFFKSVRILIKVSGEDHPDVAFVYNGIGGIYSRIGQWEKANEYYQKALAIREKTQTTDHPETAIDYDRIGEVHQKNGDWKAAEQAYQKALAIRTKTLPSDHHVFGDSYLNLGVVALHKKNFDQAESLLKKSLAIKEKKLQPYHLSITDNYLQLASVANAQKDYSTALNYYQTALQRLVPDFASPNLAENPAIDASFSHKSKLTDVLYRKGKTLQRAFAAQSEKDDYLTFAYETLQMGSKVADLNRLEYQSNFSKQAFLDNAFLIYKDLLEVAALRRRQSKQVVTESDLFALMEKSKSMLLLETLNDNSAKVYAGVPAPLLDEEQQLKKQIAYFENQLLQRKEGTDYPADKRSMELEEKVFQLRQNYEGLVADLESNYPKYHQLKYDSRLATIVDIQTNLPSDKSALLQYNLTDEKVYLMAIAKGTTVFLEQAVDSSFYQQLAAVKQFLNTNPAEQANKVQLSDKQNFIKNAHALYQQLLAPVLAKLEGVNEWVIIPDGALHYLPFEALLTELPTPPYDAFDQLAYVIDDHIIHYEYSATLWWQNVQQPKEIQPVFAGFAPEYQGDNLLAARGASPLGFAGTRTTFTPLKYNQTEVQELAGELKGRSVLGEAATESAFKQNADKFGVLHLAMHAFVNDKNPNYSHLVFAEEKDSTEDRYLHAYELYNMQLKADLAVLSACETGAGQLQQGEGVMSLSRAFKYAGVPNIVMSFWKADDFYTKNIMTQFYQFLQNGEGKHEALQRAKKAQIAAAKDNKEAAHPFYWANFVLVGNGAPVQFGHSSWMGWLACGFLLLLGLLGRRKVMV